MSWVETKHFALPVGVRSGTTDFLRVREERMRRKEQVSLSALGHTADSGVKKRPEHDIADPFGGGFGTNTPHWTIGISRPPERPPGETPGPTTYDVPRMGLKSANPSDARGGSIGEKVGPDAILRSTDAPEDFKSYVARSFPEIRPMHIGVRPETVLAERVTTNSGPSYVPPNFGTGHLYKPKRSIGVKYNDKTDSATPGPGAYSPVDPGMSRTIVYSVPRSSVVTYTDRVKQTDGPGPAAYTIEKPLIRAPRWTNRAREKSKKFQKLCNERDQPWNPNWKPK